MVLAWRARQWLGVPTGTLMAAMLPQAREISLMALRSDPLRVVVAAEAPLSPGDVRGTRIRLVSAVAAALAELRRAAHLPVATPLVGVLDPDPDPEPDRPTSTRERRARLSGAERSAYEQAAREAGFTPVGVMSIPEAVARRPATPPALHSVARRLMGSTTLSEGGDLLLTAAVAGLRGELDHPQSRNDDLDVSTDWAVESLAGATW